MACGGGGVPGPASRAKGTRGLGEYGCGCGESAGAEPAEESLPERGAECAADSGPRPVDETAPGCG
ncbi:hypothetical protein GCM10022403_014200 [Streptomyces coacervatus]|uniref:Uncharacterized protein n=1 Tax=Streptomyces coacervatus TaxID=647381 RepID=A0ABP7H218_9ACTN